MKKKKVSKLWMTLSCVSATLMVAMIVGNIVAEKNKPTINWFFNVKDTDTKGKGEIRYSSDYTKKNDDGSVMLNDKGQEVYDDEALAKDGDALNVEVAEEGIVLLKNNGALPLAENTKVSVFGQSSAHIVTSGTGSGATAGNSATFATSMEMGGLNLVQESYDFYKSGAGAGYKSSVPGMHDSNPFVIGECPWSVIASSGTYSTVVDCDTAVVVFSRNGGEGYDLSNGASTVGYDAGAINCSDARTIAEGSLTGNNYLELNGDERGVLAGLKGLKDSGRINKVVVLLNSANAMQLDFLNKDICGVDYGVDACLWIGATGQSGLNAVGKILSGKVNPSGRVVDTYCYDNLREPSIYNFGHHSYSNFDTDFLTKSKAEGTDIYLNQKYYNVYREGIYVGYRYYETRYADSVLGNGNAGTYGYGDIVANSFGNGLSYTNFEYSGYSVTESEDHKSYDIKVTVTNKGERAGKEVVEVYAQTPYGDYAKTNGMEKAAIELVGFNKTKLLEKNASEEITVNVPKEYLASYDANTAKTYVMDEGDYYLALGNGAHDALNRILKAQGADDAKIISNETTFTSTEDLVYKFHQDETDTTTYSKSSSTGADITNKFDNADLNKYANNGGQTINYVSRKDWKDSFDDSTLESMKATSVSLTMTEEMYKELINNQYTAPAEAASAVMPKMGVKNGLKLVEFFGKKEGETVTKGGKEYTWEDFLDQLTFAQMRDLIVKGQHCTGGIPSIGKPATSDQNGPSGFSSTFVGGGSGTSFPASCLRAATFNKELAMKVGKHIGEDGLHSGCSGLYGPAANTHRNAYCGRNFEYYSEDPILSSLYGAEEVKGIQSKGVVVYEKHFALNDSESHREGVGVWTNEQAAREVYLEAFREILKKDGGNAHAIMSSFSRLGTTWTSDSNELMNGVARGEWGFDGFIVTDADSCNTGVLNTGYMFAPRAVTSGTDIYDGNDNLSRSTQLNQYIKDAYVVSCMRESASRILRIVGNSSAMNGLAVSVEVVSVMPWWQKLTVGIMIFFIVTTVLFLALLFLHLFGILKFPKQKEPKAVAEGDSASEVQK